jgi:hypothetical protein
VVLSIGKLAATQAKYYLDQAEGRVDVIESVGEGGEEYYLGGTEAPGVWLGGGARGSGWRAPWTDLSCGVCWPASIREMGHRCGVGGVACGSRRSI